MARGAPPSSRGMEANVHRGSRSLRTRWQVPSVGELPQGLACWPLTHHICLLSFLVRVQVLTVQQVLLNPQRPQCDGRVGLAPKAGVPSGNGSPGAGGSPGLERLRSMCRGWSCFLSCFYSSLPFHPRPGWALILALFHTALWKQPALPPSCSTKESIVGPGLCVGRGGEG